MTGLRETLAAMETSTKPASPEPKEAEASPAEAQDKEESQGGEAAAPPEAAEGQETEQDKQRYMCVCVALAGTPISLNTAGRYAPSLHQ